MKRLDQITFTRFAMILLVMFFHGGGGIYTAQLDFFPLSDLLRSAPTAVSYLYVLSGFVMSLVYYRPGEKFDIFGYWRTRFVRIYPLYIISFALTCVYYLDSLLNIKPQKILANIFVVQAWIPAYSQSFNYASWSMTVEFFFYAIFPFFTLWAYRQSTKKLITVSLLLWAVSQLVHYSFWLYFYPEQTGLLYYFPLFHLNSFILGAVGGIWYLKVGQEQQGLKPETSTWVVVGTFLLIAAYTAVSSSIYPSLPHNLQPMAGLLAPVMIAFVVALAMNRTRMSKFLEHPALVALGETSYAIYILHVPVVWLLERWLEGAFPEQSHQIMSIIYLPLMIAVGLVTHFFIDSPLRRRLRSTLLRINVPLLFLDLLIFGASVFLVFRLRFGEGRDFQSYRDLMRLMFWSAFIFRTVLSVWFGASYQEMMQRPLIQVLRSVVLSVTLGTVLIAGITYIGYSMDLHDNFPRSIFLYDWLVVFSLSLLVRLGFRALKVYKPDPIPA